MSPPAEVALALGYAGFLLAVAEGLARLVRPTAADGARRADRTWPSSDAAHFHAGLGAALVVLAALVLVVAALRHPHAGLSGPLVLGLGAVAVAARRAVRRLRTR